MARTSVSCVSWLDDNGIADLEAAIMMNHMDDDYMPFKLSDLFSDPSICVCLPGSLSLSLCVCVREI